jgi:fucose permease
LIGFMFSDLDKAFRNSSIFMFIIGFLFPLASSLLVLALSSALKVKDASIRIPINWVCLLISPFNCLNNALRNIIYDGFILMAKTPEEKGVMQEFKAAAKEAYGDQELEVCVLIFLGQAFVLFLLCVLLDWRNMNSFKGKDKNKQKVERLQLPQNEDVQ